MEYLRLYQQSLQNLAFLIWGYEGESVPIKWAAWTSRKKRQVLQVYTGLKAAYPPIQTIYLLKQDTASCIHYETWLHSNCAFHLYFGSQNFRVPSHISQMERHLKLEFQLAETSQSLISEWFMHQQSKYSANVPGRKRSVLFYPHEVRHTHNCSLFNQ